MYKLSNSLEKSSWSYVLHVQNPHLYLPVLESQKKSYVGGRWHMQDSEEI